MPGVYGDQDAWVRGRPVLAMRKGTTMIELLLILAAAAATAYMIWVSEGKGRP